MDRYKRSDLARAGRAGTRPRRTAALALLGLVALGTGSCATRSPAATPAGSTGERELSRTHAAPDWRFEKLSWDKLASIESWLDSEGGRAQASLRLEGELQLAEGWTEFTRRDLDERIVPTESLRVRLERARELLRGVIEDPRATPGQTARAQIALDGSSALLQVPTAIGVQPIPRARWGARPAIAARMTPLRGAWSRLTVHHSAETSSDPEGGSLDETAAALRKIQRHQMEGKGWGDIGYHFVIDASGRIYEGRTLQWQGAHASGNNNNQNIGICLLGDFSRATPTPAAMKSLELLVRDLRKRYRITTSRIYAHKHFRPTVCPGPALESWVERLRR